MKAHLSGRARIGGAACNAIEILLHHPGVGRPGILLRAPAGSQRFSQGDRCGIMLIKVELTYAAGKVGEAYV